MGREHYDALGEAIGVVNQAIIKLELPLKQDQAKNEDNVKEIPYPKRLTLKWLYQHAPMRLLGWFFGLLFTAFALGISFSETQLYQLLKSKASEPVLEPELNKSKLQDPSGGTH